MCIRDSRPTLRGARTVCPPGRAAETANRSPVVERSPAPAGQAGRRLTGECPPWPADHPAQECDVVAKPLATGAVTREREARGIPDEPARERKSERKCRQHDPEL